MSNLRINDFQIKKIYCLIIYLYDCVLVLLRESRDPKIKPLPTARAPSTAPTATGPRNIPNTGWKKARQKIEKRKRFFIAAPTAVCESRRTF